MYFLTALLFEFLLFSLESSVTKSDCIFVEDFDASCLVFFSETTSSTLSSAFKASSTNSLLPSDSIFPVIIALVAVTVAVSKAPVLVIPAAILSNLLASPASTLAFVSLDSTKIIFVEGKLIISNLLPEAKVTIFLAPSDVTVAPAVVNPDPSNIARILASVSNG